MAACSGVKCATLWVAASTFLSNEATVAEESAARPRPLPASERKSRRVGVCTDVNSAVAASLCRGVFSPTRRTTVATPRKWKSKSHWSEAEIERSFFHGQEDDLVRHPLVDGGVGSNAVRIGRGLCRSQASGGREFFLLHPRSAVPP